MPAQAQGAASAQKHQLAQKVHGETVEERQERLSQEAMSFFLATGGEGSGCIWVVLYLLFPFLQPLLRMVRPIFPEPQLVISSPCLHAPPQLTRNRIRTNEEAVAKVAACSCQPVCGQSEVGGFLAIFCD